MIGPTPTRMRQLRKTDAFYTPRMVAMNAQPARVLCTRCSICGLANAPFGYPGNHYYCAAHRQEGEYDLAR